MCDTVNLVLRPMNVCSNDIVTGVTWGPKGPQSSQIKVKY